VIKAQSEQGREACQIVSTKNTLISHLKKKKLNIYTSIFTEEHDDSNVHPVTVLFFLNEGKKKALLRLHAFEHKIPG